MNGIRQGTTQPEFGTISPTAKIFPLALFHDDKPGTYISLYFGHNVTVTTNFFPSLQHESTFGCLHFRYANISFRKEIVGINFRRTTGRFKSMMHSHSLRSLMERFLATGELPSKSITQPALRKLTLDGIDFAFRRMQDDPRHMRESQECFDELGYTLPADRSRDHLMKLPGHGTGDVCATIRNQSNTDEHADDEVINYASAEELMDDMLLEDCAMPEGEEIFHLSRQKRQIEQGAGELDRVLHAMEDERALVLPANLEPENPRFLIPSIPLRSRLPDEDWQAKIEELPRLAGKPPTVPRPEQPDTGNAKLISQWSKEELISYCIDEELPTGGSVKTLKKRVFLRQTSKSFNIPVEGPRWNLAGELFSWTKAKLMVFCKTHGVRCQATWQKEVVLQALLRFLFPKDDPWAFIGHPTDMPPGGQDVAMEGELTHEPEEPDLLAVEPMDIFDEEQEEEMGEADMDIVD